MAMAKDNKFIYASYKKFDAKKGMQIDEDLTYSSEEDAIEHFIKRLSGIDEDMEEEFNDGDDIKIYLYQLDKNRTPYLFKKVEVEKDDSDAGYKITDEDEEELPDDFVPYSDDDDSSEEDGQTEDKKDKNEDEMTESVTTINPKQNFYFYHLLPKGANIQNGITSLDYQYRHNINEFRKNSSKYRDRLCGGWKIYPGRDPKSLSDKEVYDGINMFRKSNQGCNQIYLFKYPPHRKLGSKMRNILKFKDIYRIDLNELRNDGLLSDIDFGYVDSNSDNDKLTEDWYRNVTYNDYFKKYTETDPNRLLFSYMNHISVTPKDGCIPKRYLTKIAQYVPEPIERDLEESVLSLSDKFYDNYEFVKEVADKAYGIIKEFGLNDDESLRESMSYVSEGVEQVLNVLSESMTGYKDQLVLSTIHQYFTEKTLKAKDRNALDESEFGIPSLRKYPMPDKAHVKAAIQRFNHVEPKYEKELADNIIKAMKKFNMMNEVEVGKDNRFKKYIDSSYKEFKESYDINPFPLELTKEFSVGAMLPMMGSTDGWGTKLANTPIEDVVASNNQDMEKYATLYDTSELENDAIEYRKKIYTGTSLDDGIITREQALCESVIPHRNIIFDKEVEELVKKLKEFINNPKNDFMEDILKKSLNFKKNIYTIKLNDQDGKDSNKVITKIKSCGFRDVDDQGVKVLYEKEVKGLLLTLIYDTVGDKIRVTYEPYDKDKELKESAEILEASKDDIDEDIRAIVDKLNRKGYKTKYSCSGHTKARIKEDGYRNGIYKGKLYTTARIVFDDDYKLNPPKGWKIKTFDGKIGIYPVAPDYNYSNGVPDDAFEKWKNEYMAELKMWVNGLPDKPGPTEESVDDLLDDFSELLFNESIIDAAKNALKKPKISGKNKFENTLNLTFKGIKISVDKKRSDEDSEMFLKRVKLDLSWLNKAYNKALNTAIEEDLLKLADKWELPKSPSKIKSLMKLDYVAYIPGPGDNKCRFHVAFNTTSRTKNDKFFGGHSYWITLDFENGENIQNEWTLQG